MLSAKNLSTRLRIATAAVGALCSVIIAKVKKSARKVKRNKKSMVSGEVIGEECSRLVVNTSSIEREAAFEQEIIRLSDIYESYQQHQQITHQIAESNDEQFNFQRKLIIERYNELQELRLVCSVARKLQITHLLSFQVCSVEPRLVDEELEQLQQHGLVRFSSLLC